MKYLLSLLLFVSCAHKQSDLVSTQTALNQAHASYLKGCVDAHISMSQRGKFVKCKDWADEHYREIKEILDSNEQEK